MKKLLGAFLVLGLLAGACGSGGDDDKKADATTTTTTEPSKESASLNAKLLTLSDLPQGFTRTSSDDEEGSESEDDFCPSLSSIDKDIPTKYEAEVDFQAETENGIGLVNEQLSEYPSVQKATDAMNRAKEAFEHCASFTDTDEDGTVTKGTLATMPFSKVADDTFAHKLTFDVIGDLDDDASTPNDTANLEGAMIVIRSGNTIAVLMISGGGEIIPTQDDFKAVADAAAAKLA